MAPVEHIQVFADIVSLGELKARAAEIFGTLDARGPLVLTQNQNGRPACVILSPAEFDRTQGTRGLFEGRFHWASGYFRRARRGGR